MKRFLICGGVLLAVLLVLAGGLLAAVSRPWFVQRHLLPLVSRAVGMPVTAETVRFSPLWRLDLKNVRAGLAGQPDAFACKELRLRYRARALVYGVFDIQELRVDAPSIRLTRRPDGRWVVPGAPPPPAGAREAAAAGPAAPGGAGTLPLQFRLGRFELRGATVVLDLPAASAGAAPGRIELREVRVTGSGWRPGTPLELGFQGRLHCQQGEGCHIERAVCRGLVSADLDARWRPQNFRFEARVNGMAGQICGIPLETGEASVSAAGGRWGSERAELNSLSVVLSQNRRDTLRVTLTAPVVLGWGDNGRFAFGGGASRLLVRIQELPLPQFNPLLQPVFGVVFDAGTLTGDLSAESAGQGRKVIFKGTVAATGLAFHAGEQSWRELSLTSTLEASLAELARVSVYRWDTEIALGGVPCLRWQGAGNLDVRRGAGDLAISVPLCNEKVQQLVPAWRSRPPLAMLDATATLNLVLTATRQRTAGVVGRVNLLRVKTAAMAATASPLAVEVALDGLATPAGGPGRGGVAKPWQLPVELRLNSIKGRFQRDDRDLADLDLNGRLFWPVSAGENVLTTQSEFLDGRALWAVLGEAVPAFRKTVSAAPPAPAGPAGLLPAAEPAPLAALHGLNLHWRGDCRRFLWAPLELTGISIETRLRDNRISLAPLSCSVNGAPVELSASADCGVADGYPFTFNLDVASLEVAPVLAVFQPALNERIRGRVVQFTVNAGGKGISGPNLTRHLRGNAVVHGADVRLAGLPFLEQAATKTGIGELRQLVLDSVALRLDTQPDGQVKISEGQAQGPDVRLAVSGTFGWDETLDLRTELGVGGALEQRLKRDGLVQLLGRRDGDYAMLPAAIPVTGRWSRPEMTVSQAEVSATAAQVMQNLNGVIKEVKAREGHATVKTVLKALLQPNGPPPQKTTPAAGASPAAKAAAP
ncbi:MAG: hypothetical protein WC708_17825 [Lentisphaeria bacterium]